MLNTKEAFTYPAHLVPGDVHAEVGHLGTDARKFAEAFNCFGNVAVIISHEDLARRLYVLHFVLKNAPSREKAQNQ